jgi:Zn-dependent peptidase ImmA (M78 family)/DNA-binding XRE family transcriptional regulator
MALGERIKLARHTAGLSQRETGAKAGISAQAVSKYERGLDVPSSSVLLRLAPALGVRTEFLLRPARPGRAPLEYRKHGSLSRKQIDFVHARIQDWLERYLTIEEIVAEVPIFEWPSGFPYAVATQEDAEQAANLLREVWQLGIDPIPNMTELLEDRGIKVGVVPDAPQEFDACSSPPGLVDGTPVIAVSGSFPGDRQRFSLAHELAHLALDIPGDADGEALANRFAGAFLVPATAVSAELGESRHKLHLAELHLLKHKYGASMQSWIHRAEDLAVLPHSAANRLFKRFRAEGWRETEPGDAFPRETPNRIHRLVLRAIAEDLISERRAGELLGLPLAEYLDQFESAHGGLPTNLRN